MKKALIVQGGWDGHEPQLTSKRFAGLLEEEGFSVTISDTLECLRDLDELMTYDLMVACWTMGEKRGQSRGRRHGLGGLPRRYVRLL